jgi:hypothetical protein
MAETPSASLKDEVTAALLSPLTQIVSKDFARLASRFDLFLPTFTVLGQAEGDSIMSVMSTLASFFREEDTLASFDYPEASSAPDKQPLVSSLLEHLLKNNPNSRVVAVLRLTHQGVLLNGVVAMKSTPVLRDVMTKDDRSDRGWRIKVVLGEDTVQVIHRRREIIAYPPEPEGAVADMLSWELGITVSPEMDVVHAVSLRCTEVEAASERGAMLKRKLAGGDLIL